MFVGTQKSVNDKCGSWRENCIFRENPGLNRETFS